MTKIGAAKLISRMESLGDAPSRVTRRYSFVDSAVVEAPHRGDLGIDAMVDALDREGIIRPMARLTPLATIKL